METSEISEHKVRVFLFMEEAIGWKTSNEIASGAKVAPRTARAIVKNLVGLGILDMAEVFPGHRYRVATQAEKRNKAFVLRLREAASVFGLSG